MKKLTAFLLIAVYLGFVGVVTLHVHESQDPTSHLHCKLCEVHKLSVEKAVDSSLNIELSTFNMITSLEFIRMMLDDSLQLSGTDPPWIRTSASFLANS